jgi:hypothetical protein
LRPEVQRTLRLIFFPLLAHTILASTSIFIYYFGKCVITYPNNASNPTIIVAVDVTIILNFSSLALDNKLLMSLQLLRFSSLKLLNFCQKQLLNFAVSFRLA